MNHVDYLEGFAFCAIRPAVALFLIPFGQSGSLGIALRLPVLGRVAAGAPIGADVPADMAESFLVLDRVLFSPSPDYLLKVKGDSMRDEGIFEGDLIGVHRTPEARDGQIVVARIEGELTIKRLERGRFIWPPLVDDGVVLTPAQFALLVEAMDWRRTVAPAAPRVPMQM